MQPTLCCSPGALACYAFSGGLRVSSWSSYDSRKNASWSETSQDRFAGGRLVEPAAGGNSLIEKVYFLGASPNQNPGVITITGIAMVLPSS